MLISATRNLLCVFFTLALISACGNAHSDGRFYAPEVKQGSVTAALGPSLSADGSSKVISLSLSIDKDGVSDAEVLLKSILVNNSSERIVFLPWGTPFENAITADFLTIIDIESGEKLSYQGIMVKRRAPKSEDYLSLDPGDSVESVLDVSRSYNFCGNKQYTIEFSGALYDPEYVSLEIQSNRIELDLVKSVNNC